MCDPAIRDRRANGGPVGHLISSGGLFVGFSILVSRGVAFVAILSDFRANSENFCRKHEILVIKMRNSPHFAVMWRNFWGFWNLVSRGGVVIDSRLK